MSSSKSIIGKLWQPSLPYLLLSAVHCFSTGHELSTSILILLLNGTFAKLQTRAEEPSQVQDYCAVRSIIIITMILSNCDEISLVSTLRKEHASYMFDFINADLHISSKNVLCVMHIGYVCSLSVCVNVLSTVEYCVHFKAQLSCVLVLTSQFLPAGVNCDLPLQLSSLLSLYFSNARISHSSTCMILAPECSDLMITLLEQPLLPRDTLTT